MSCSSSTEWKVKVFFIQMDDSEMESEFQEDSSSDGGGKMNWMLDKGLILGKKALFTGILISSAPFVLPPLVVLSALGLAFSVPSGLAVASYACTEKIMSKLLPMPDPAPMALAYLEEISGDDEEDEMVFGGEIDMRRGEELMDVTKRGVVGVRIEFVDEGKGEWIEEKALVEQDNLGPECILNDEVAEPVTQLGGDHLVEESGYEEDVKDDIPKKDEQPLGDIDMGVEESRDGKVQRLVIAFEKSDNNVEEIRDENPVNEIQKVVVKAEKTDESVREGETPIQVTTKADSTNENELDDEEDEMVFGGEIDMRRGEELMDVTKRGVVGVRIEFVEEVKGEWVEEKALVEQDNLGPECILNDEVAEPVTQLGGDHLVEESGYEEDVEDDIPKKDEQPLGDIDMGVEESRDGKVHRLVIAFEKSDNNVEEIRDENPVNETQKVVVKAEKTDESVREGETPIQVTTMADSTNENELAPETTGLLERIRDENKSMEEAEQQEEDIPGGNRDETGVDIIVEAEKPINVGFETLDVRSIMEEEQSLIVCQRSTLVVGVDADNCVAEDVPFDLSKENAISSNADIREIADISGFDLFDEQNAAVEQYPHRVANVGIGNILKTDVS